MTAFFERLLSLRRLKRILGGRFDPETIDARMDRLNALAILVMSEDNWLYKTEQPSKSDLAFLGTFIQAYCVADFNARRAVNALRAVSDGDESDFASQLNDTDVLVHLRICAFNWTGTSTVSEGTIKAVEILEMHRIHRHNFAHWIVRRLKHEHAFVMLTRNSTEARRRDGIPLSANAAKWALVMIDGLKKNEMKKLQGHSDFLGKLAIYLDKNRSRLREEHLER